MSAKAKLQFQIIYLLLILIQSDENIAVSTLKITNNILQNYNQTVQYPKDGESKLNVKLQPTLYSLSDVNILGSTFTAAGFVSLQWYDDRLKWNPSDYENNITEILINPTLLWIPDIQVSQYSEVSNEATDKSQKVHVRSDGTLLQSWKMTFFVPQNYNLKQYPSDKHNITIKFESWSYNNDKIILELFNDSKPIDINYFIQPSEFRLIETSAHHVNNTQLLGIYSGIDLHIIIARHPNLIIANVLYPSLFIALLTICVIILPMSISEKLPLLMNLLIIVSVYQLLLVQNLPASNNNSITESIIYFVFIMALILTLLAMFLLFFKQGNQINDPVPKIYQLIQQQFTSYNRKIKIGYYFKKHNWNDINNYENNKSNEVQLDEQLINKFSEQEDLNNTINNNDNIYHYKSNEYNKTILDKYCKDGKKLSLKEQFQLEQTSNDLTNYKFKKQSNAFLILMNIILIISFILLLPFLILLKLFYITAEQIKSNTKNRNIKQFLKIYFGSQIHGNELQNTVQKNKLLEYSDLGSKIEIFVIVIVSLVFSIQLINQGIILLNMNDKVLPQIK